MKKRFPQLFVVLTVFMFSFSLGTSAWSAKMPASQDNLEQDATHIITAKVLEVASKIEKSKFETGIGNTDKVFSIRVQVASTAKGKDIQRGDTILVIAWKPQTRIGAGTIGFQGHDQIPTRNQMATFYLKQNGKHYEPIMPNGIQVKEQ